MGIAFRKIILPELNQHISTGVSVTVQAQIVRVGSPDVLVLTSQIPLITLYTPANVALITDQTMTPVSVGLYQYVYRLPASAALGVYRGSFTAVHEDSVAHIEKVTLWRAVIQADFTDVTYNAIRDQAGNIWYWYVDNAGQLVISATVPTFIVKDAVALNTVIPYWVALTNSLMQTRYVYPDVLGQLVVSNSQPAVGSGVVGTYTWTAENTSRYEMSVDITDQTILDTV